MKRHIFIGIACICALCASCILFTGCAGSPAATGQGGESTATSGGVSGSLTANTSTSGDADLKPSSGAIDSNTGEYSSSFSYINDNGNQVVRTFAPRLGYLWDFEGTNARIVTDSQGKQSIAVDVNATCLYSEARSLSAINITAKQGETELSISSATDDAGNTLHAEKSSLPSVDPEATKSFTICYTLTNTQPVTISFGGYVDKDSVAPTLQYDVE